MTCRRRSRRERIALRLPAALGEFPFEVFVSLAAIVIGFPSLLGYTRPGSLLASLPLAALPAWGLSMTLGGGTILVGLIWRISSALIAGLRLAAVSFFVYAIAVLGYTGFVQGGVAASLFVTVTTLCLLRSFYLRSNTLLARSLRREE